LDRIDGGGDVELPSGWQLRGEEERTCGGFSQSQVLLSRIASKSMDENMKAGRKKKKL